MLSERIRSQKTKNFKIPFIRQRKFIYREKKISGCLGGRMGNTANEYMVSFLGNEYVLKLDCDDGCTTL